MNTKEINPYIFISYAHNDASMAKRITKFLQDEGFDVWIDYNDIRAGEKFNDKIAQAIYDSSLFISLVSSVYLTKPFCGEEITYAHNHQKNCMPVYIEATTPPPGHALDFIFTASSQAGYNKNIENDDDFNELCQSIINSVYIDHLRDYIQDKTNKGPMPFVRPSIFDNVEKFYQKVTKGNYYLTSIEKELFPPFKLDSQLENSSNNNELLLEKIINDFETSFLIIGAGGSGKTVALRSIYRYFMSNGSPVVYIPLNKIPFSERVSILSYLEDELDLDWDILKRYGKCNSNSKPLRFLFDGLNEIQGDRKKVLQEISEIMRWDNTQVIISSRSDFSNILAQDILFKTISLQPLEANVVKDFLEKKDINTKFNSKMLLLLCNPLMLMLYVNTDVNMYKPLSKYTSYYRIEISSEPTSEAHIIWNYLQSQLYRVDEGFSSQLVCDAFVIIEYFLPVLANYMIINNKSEISKNEFAELLGELAQRDDYIYYYNNRLSEDIEFTLDVDEYELKKNNLKKVLFNKLSLMVESADQESYEFFHQCFRDFFAAMFIAKKLEMIAKNKTRDYEEIARLPYAIEILNYVSEISFEKRAKPIWTEEGIIYPGKNQYLSASSFSDAEKSLYLYRGLLGENAQNIVYNVYNIMSIGRDKQLSNCDFSSLDLRKCNLKGGNYSDWYCDNVYSSSFENSYIDMECFISQGHQSSIKSICEGSEGFFTADVEGTVKYWSFNENAPLWSVDTPDGPVICMDYSNNLNQLAILKQHAVYIYDIQTGTISLISSTKNTYRYVRFNNDDQIEITYDIAPLTWVDLSGTKKCDYLSVDIPCGCSAINTMHTEMLKSYLYGMVHKYDVCNNVMITEIDMSKKVDENVITGITDIKYNTDNSKFLVGFGYYIIEFDSQSLELIHKLKFSSMVNSVLYTTKNKIIVAAGVNIIVLNNDFSYFKEYLGESLPNIVKLFDNDGELYFLDTTGTIKLISDEITVQKTRRPWFKPTAIAFGYDGFDRQRTKMFTTTSARQLTGGKPRTCIGYDYDKNIIFDLSNDYEIFNVFHGKGEPEYEFHKLANKIIAINKKTGERILFVNYKGITIYGCNFKNILGSITKTEGVRLLTQNGGTVND